MSFGCRIGAALCVVCHCALAGLRRGFCGARVGAQELRFQIWSIDFAVVVLGQLVELPPACRNHVGGQQPGQTPAQVDQRYVLAGRRRIGAADQPAFEAVGFDGDYRAFLQVGVCM